MSPLGIILLIFVVLLLFGGVAPIGNWGYGYGYGHGSIGGLGLLLLILLVLVLLGKL